MNTFVHNFRWWFVVFLSVDSDGVNVLARHLIFDFWHMKNCISTPFGIIGGICGSVHCSQILFESDRIGVKMGSVGCC